MLDLQEQFGPIDIYLFDQLLRGRIRHGMRVLDAGCGTGRNLVHLLRAGYDVFAADADPAAIRTVRRLAAALAPDLPEENFRVEAVEAMSFPQAFADVVIGSAVLHFAAGDEQFAAMLRGMWRAVAPGGMLFCRLASSIGMENRIEQIAGRRFMLPDGSTRYLVDEAVLLGWSRELGGELLDPLKTTIVQDQRCMTTWVLKKQVPAPDRTAGHPERGLR